MAMTKHKVKKDSSEGEREKKIDVKGTKQAQHRAPIDIEGAHLVVLGHKTGKTNGVVSRWGE